MFTKGEWRAEQSGTAIMAGGKRIATVNQVINRVEREAIAHLIAAAPMMYEALKELSGFKHLTDSTLGEKIKQALAKAEGK